MTRITSSASNTILIARLLQTQARLNDLQLQVASEKRSQTYSGLPTDSQRLINVENTRDSLERFNATNVTAGLRTDIQASALEGIEKAIKDFRGFLVDFTSGNVTDPDRISDLQDNALRGLLDIQSLLNTEADGRFVFAGGDVRTQPVNFGISSKAAFQSTFDGSRVTVSTTRDAHLENFSINRNSTNLSAAFLSFQQTGGNGDSRITSASAQFQNIAVGTTITLSDTPGGLNDGTYTVKAVDTSGNWIDVETEQLTDETTPVTVTFTYPNATNPLNNDTVTTEVTFDRQTNTITSTTLNALTNIPAGTVVTITGAGNAANNSTFTVDSNDNTNLVIKSKRLIDDGGTGAVVHTAAGGNTLTFVDGGAGADTIVASTAGTYSSLQIGQKIEIAGTSTNNDGRIFTIAGISADGATITLGTGTGNQVVAAAGLTAGTLSTKPEYFDFNAAQPLFTFTDTNAADIAFAGSTITLVGQNWVDQTGTALQAGDTIDIPAGVTGTANDGSSFTIVSVAGAVATVTPAPAAGNSNGGGGNITVRPAVTFTDNNSPTADTITGRPGAFFGSDGQALPAGTVITIANATSANINNSFTIASVNSTGSTATLIPTNNFNIGGAGATEVSTATLTITAHEAKGTVAADSYYDGDQISLTHRASASRTFEFDVNAADPAFEKAVRAMKLILQGGTGTEGGLDQNQERATQALFLLDSALDITNTSPPPFGTEEEGSVEQISIDLGFRSVLIDNIKQVNDNVIAFLDANVADTENIDPLESITELLDNQRTLEASYQTFARVRQLSLTAFI